ncbi:FkbM family methyltransferase [Cylindrospermopsis raciborskii UAM/DH-MRr]|uniref:FkbM family methyltransferase n=1 Tax=Cylindrospermopsis raciborskii TaxID=77022 RepID=UPI003879A40A
MIFNLLYKSAYILEKLSAFAQGKGYGSRSIRQEIAVAKKLMQSLKPELLMIDIGGNIGDYTYQLRKGFKQAEVHIFEPSIVNVNKLSQRFKGDPLVILNPVGVSNCEGSFLLYSNEQGSGIASLSKRRLDHFDISFDFSEQIQTICFENYWINQLNRKRINLVKLDIEGHELDALRGFGSAIWATELIQFEFGGCNLDTHTTFQDFFYFFKEHNYEIYRITPFGSEKISKYREIDEFYSTTNFIARNRSLL